jgi:hypothetical protein
VAPRFGCQPDTDVAEVESLHDAITRSGGKAWNRAPNTAPQRRFDVTARAATAAGGRGFTMVPAGAVIRIGSMMPWFGIRFGSRTALTQ